VRYARDSEAKKSCDLKDVHDRRFPFDYDAIVEGGAGLSTRR
jgi:hypothetical protein